MAKEIAILSYPVLKKEKEIRILRLIAGNGSPIADLETEPSYEALSYEWMDERKTQTAIVFFTKLELPSSILLGQRICSDTEELAVPGKLMH